MHLNIYGLGIDLCGQKYFIYFIDNYLRYMYLYFFHNKIEVLNAFKVSKAQVENANKDSDIR